MKWKLISEGKSTPSDMKSIEASIVGDESDEKYTPTVEFARNAYDKLNRDLFFRYLPPVNEVTFTLSDGIRSDELGAAECIINTVRNRMWASDFKLSLDKTAKLTLHSWLGVVLHEMIHILEYQEHPENKQDPKYDWHGDWFKKTGEKFKKYGFDFSKFYDGPFEVDDEDERVKNIMKDEMFIQVWKTSTGIPQIVKIRTIDKNKVCKFLRDEENVKEVVVLQTDNPMSVKILPIDIHELEQSSFRVYHMSRKFDEMYGPFKEVETISLDNLVSEGIEDDEEVERIRHQKGVVHAERISPTAIRVVVS